jgi:threonine dehydrogenase-like Zn-dependent dehydrogenase
LVSGAGSIGFTVCQVARAFGATTVVAADVSDAQLAAVGPWVDETVNTSGMSPTEAARDLCDAGGTIRGFDIAFETAGHPSSLATTVEAIRPGGKALLMGICDGPTALRFEDYLGGFIKREVALITTFGFTRQDFLTGNSLYADGRLDLQPLIGPTIGLEQVPEVLAHIAEHGTGGKRYVVDVGVPKAVATS